MTILASLAFLGASTVMAVSTTVPVPTPPQVPAVTSPRSQAGPARRLRVYLDCEQCVSDYLRGEIEWVDFVRQPQDADVQLLASSRETVGRHEFAATFDQKQRWGSLEIGVEALQYLEDLSKYRLEAQASRVRDQTSLPRRGATPEEVLLRLPKTTERVSGGTAIRPDVQLWLVVQ